MLRKWTGSYKFTELQVKINHLMYMNDIKISKKKKKKKLKRNVLESLIHTITI